VKTAISIPDRLFEAAERLAKRLGMSRSELYSKAVQTYLDANRSSGVRERLDAVYETESARLDDDVAKMQSESIPEEKW
jgi:metal-responsive CopG/Arc/MetJ family transcriptional regulator